MTSILARRLDVRVDSTLDAVYGFSDVTYLTDGSYVLVYAKSGSTSCDLFSQRPLC